MSMFGICAMVAVPVREGIPGWPLEWVSGSGRYSGKTESLVLIRSTAMSVEPGKKSLLLTARDRRRRAWSSVLTLESGPLLDAFEAELARSANVPLREIGDAILDPQQFLVNKSLDAAIVSKKLETANPRRRARARARDSSVQDVAPRPSQSV